MIKIQSCVGSVAEFYLIFDSMSQYDIAALRVRGLVPMGRRRAHVGAAYPPI